MKPGIKETFLVGAGGITGALLRQGTNLLHQSQFDQAGIFTAVFIENILGSFFIGFFYLILIKRTNLNTRLNLFLITGLFGSYTTYSGFMTESLLMIQESFLLFLGYMGLQVFFGILAVIGGIKSGRVFKNRKK